jgi:hypothetical protein
MSSKPSDMEEKMPQRGTKAQKDLAKLLVPFVLLCG